jgi:hypothetical protein
MNIQVVFTIMRQVLIALMGAAVAKGLIGGELVEPIVAGVLAIATAVWGIYAKKKDQAVIKAIE